MGPAELLLAAQAALGQGDVVEPAMAFETMFGHYSSLTPSLPVTLERLAALEPSTLALMHVSTFRGDGGTALRRLAEAYDERFLART